MKEFLGSVEWIARSVEQFDATLSQVSRIGYGDSSLQFSARLDIQAAYQDYEVLAEVQRRQITIELPDDLLEDTKQMLGKLEGPLDIRDWLEIVEQEPLVRASIQIRLDKKQDLQNGQFMVLTIEGFERATEYCLKEGLTREPRILIQSPLVESPSIGTGLIVAPILWSGTVPAGPLIVPPLEGELSLPLGTLQINHLAINVLGLSSTIGGIYSAEKASKLAAWLYENELRPTILRRYLQERAFPLEDEGLGKLMRDLEILQASLISDTMSRFLEAKKAFGSVSIDLLRDVAAMRQDITTVIRNEAFQITVALALLAGSLAIDAPITTRQVLAVGFLLSVLFLLGTTLRLHSLVHDFNQVLGFRTATHGLPVRAAMPEFHQWYEDAVDSSSRIFHNIVAIVEVVATLPLIGVAGATVYFLTGSVWWTVGTTSAFFLIICFGALVWLYRHRQDG